MEKNTFLSRLFQMLRSKDDDKLYPELSNFIGAYFHEDYDLSNEYDEEDEVMYQNIVNCIRGNDYAIAVVNQIDKMMNDGRGITEERMIKMGCAFTPDDENFENMLLSLRKLIVKKLKADGVAIS